MPFGYLPPPDPAEHIKPITAECMLSASEQFGLHPDIMLAVLIVEGGRVGQDNCHNKDGTCDIGPAQINDIHLDELAKAGISHQMLMNDGCVNATVMAWRLADNIRDQRVDTSDDYLRAIARYHSRNEEFNAIYRERLREAFQLMYSSESDPS